MASLFGLHDTVRVRCCKLEIVHYVRAEASPQKVGKASNAAHEYTSSSTQATEHRTRNPESTLHQRQQFTEKASKATPLHPTYNTLGRRMNSCGNNFSISCVIKQTNQIQWAFSLIGHIKRALKCLFGDRQEILVTSCAYCVVFNMKEAVQPLFVLNLLSFQHSEGVNYCCLLRI